MVSRVRDDDEYLYRLLIVEAKLLDAGTLVKEGAAVICDPTSKNVQILLELPKGAFRCAPGGL